MSIGERISSLRKEQNVSQVQLAKTLGVSRQAVSKWENDLSEPDTLNLIQLANLLNTDVEYLATGKHSILTKHPEFIPVIEPVEKIVEKIVEIPVTVEKVIEIEKPVTVVKRVYRTRYLRNPIEFILTGLICFILGLLLGFLF